MSVLKRWNGSAWEAVGGGSGGDIDWGAVEAPNFWFTATEADENANHIVGNANHITLDATCSDADALNLQANADGGAANIRANGENGSVYISANGTGGTVGIDADTLNIGAEALGVVLDGVNHAIGIETFQGEGGGNNGAIHITTNDDDGGLISLSALGSNGVVSLAASGVGGAVNIVAPSVSLEAPAGDIQMEASDSVRLFTSPTTALEVRDSDSAITIGALKLGFFDTAAVARPEIPASPTEQDIANVLIALGLATQAP